MTDHRDPGSQRVELRLEGAEAAEGIAVTALESFIDGFVRALRTFDRVRHGGPPVKVGQPGKRGSAVTALKVVSLTRGSAVLVLEPAKAMDVDDDVLFEYDDDLALDNLDSLLAALEQGEVHEEVADALGRARSALGAGGTIAIRSEWGGREQPVVVDEATIERLQTRAENEQDRGLTISGRLHMIDTERPLKVGIRSGDGVDWRCRFPDSWPGDVVGLVGRTVWATGRGKLTGPRTGTLQVTELHAVTESDQTPFYRAGHPSVQTLMAEQRVVAAQGTPAAPSDLTEEELDRFLEALSG